MDWTGWERAGKPILDDRNRGGAKGETGRESCSEIWLATHSATPLIVTYCLACIQQLTSTHEDKCVSCRLVALCLTENCSKDYFQFSQLTNWKQLATVRLLSSYFLKVRHARFLSNTNVSIYLWEDDLSPKQESVDSACLLKSGSLLKDKTGPTKQFGLQLTELLVRLSNHFRNPFLPLGLASIPFFGLWHFDSNQQGIFTTTPSLNYSDHLLIFQAKKPKCMFLSCVTLLFKLSLLASMGLGLLYRQCTTYSLQVIFCMVVVPHRGLPASNCIFGTLPLSCHHSI